MAAPDRKTFPKEMIAPNVGFKAPGILQNIVPMLAIASTF